MSESLYPAHARSPIRPRLQGDTSPQKKCEGCMEKLPLDQQGFHYSRNSVFAYKLQCRARRGAPL